MKLQGFRNYAMQEIHFGNGINILYGDNAQGKTNIVEAIHLLATGKSHRTRHLTDMIQHGQTRFVVEAILCDRSGARLEGMNTDVFGDSHLGPDQREISLHLSYDKRSGKHMMVNEVTRTRWSELLGQMHVLLFSPETMDVVKGGPSERRRFLDILLCQIDSRYLRSLQHYTAILRQKSTALRDRNGFSQYRDMMPVWNESMAQHAGYLAKQRFAVVTMLQTLANEELKKISGGRELLSMKLQSFVTEEEHDDRNAEAGYAARLLEKLNRLATREEQAGACLAGIHRDELQISLNDSSARVFASQGQQRTIALSMILASLRYYQQQTGDKPLLLLDDVMSELDPRRQAYLLEALEKTQTVMTTTDRHAYDGKLPDETLWFSVNQGLVREDTPLS
jgi:DNA replication and repair protein RecF